MLYKSETEMTCGNDTVRLNFEPMEDNRIKPVTIYISDEADRARSAKQLLINSILRKALYAPGKR